MNNISQLLRLIQQNTTFDEKSIAQSIRNVVLVDDPKNKKEYLCDMLKSFDTLVSQLHNSCYMLLIQSEERSEVIYTPLKVSQILNVSKGAILKHIEAKNIEVQQKVKGGKIIITMNAMDNFVKKYPKYKNLWDNRNLKFK